MTTTILIPEGSLPPYPLPPEVQFLPVPAGVDHLNRALDSVPSGHILLTTGLDRLDLEALPALCRAASAPGVAGAVGRFRFTSPIGDLPIPAGTPDPQDRLPLRLALPELASFRPIPSAVLINRDVLGDQRLRADLAAGAEFDLILRLAQVAPFAHCPHLLARRYLAPLTDAETSLRDLAAHIAILADFSTEQAAADLIDAVIVLRAHQRALADRGSSQLAATTRFPFTFAQWWHRCGLYGPAPRHILEANGGVAEAVSADPSLIAGRILSLCPRGKPPVLLGLGRNARTLARSLHRAGSKVIGRDDSTPPAWAVEDGIPIQIINKDQPFDTSATYIMTVLHDETFMARLPEGLRIIRWRDIPALILAEWRSAALDWALRTGTASREPALIGAFP